MRVRDPGDLAFITQTTLSIDDTAAIVAVLRRRFPDIVGPRKEDICYATTNRQQAVKAIAARVDAILIVGAANSSNSMRLVEVARNVGCARAALIQRAAEIDWSFFDGVERIGLTAGASAPEVLVEDVIAALRRLGPVEVSTLPGRHETIEFRLPAELNRVA